MVEALSQGLSGHGRKDAPKRWGGNTFVQVISPDLFAGSDAFEEQMDHLSDRCRSNKPIHANQPVRMPGDAAARGIAAAQLQGISYDEATWHGLGDWARILVVNMPVSLVKQT
jgi:LDH2 family malate/lactate/ureidoglycolate dehydrogenase